VAWGGGTAGVAGGGGLCIESAHPEIATRSHGAVLVRVPGSRRRGCRGRRVMLIGDIGPLGRYRRRCRPLSVPRPLGPAPAPAGRRSTPAPPGRLPALLLIPRPPNTQRLVRALHRLEPRHIAALVRVRCPRQRAVRAFRLALAGGSMRSISQPRSEHDLPPGSVLIQTRGGGG
jgi:hypothetical protein